MIKEHRPLLTTQKFRLRNHEVQTTFVSCLKKTRMSVPHLLRTRPVGQGRINCGHRVTLANKFFMVAPYIFGSLVWNLIHVTLRGLEF